MAFVKLYKVVVDSPMGLQTVNQLADNQTDLRTQLLVEHGGSEVALGGLTIPSGELDSLGRHNLAEVARTVTRGVLVSNSASGTTLALGVTGVGIPSVLRVSAGVYLLPVVGLADFWATLSLDAASSVTMLGSCRPFFASTTNGGNNGLWVETRKLASGSFDPFDCGFTLSLHGQL